MKKKHTTPLSREAQAFIEMLTAERGASKNTEAAYSGDLKNLEAFLARRKQKPVTADADALRAYLKSLDYVGMTSQTVARRLSVMRQLFRFLLAERLRNDDPASTLDSPRLGRPLPKVLSRAEVDRLIEAASAKGGEDGGRMSTLLEILYGAGLRVSELVTLPLSAVERDPTVLVVRGKGEKDRMVPLSDPARAAIVSWLHVRAGMFGRRELALPVSVARPDRPSHAPALRAAPQGGGARRRHRSRTRIAARPAPRLRQPPAGRRRRPAQRAIDAGPCRISRQPRSTPTCSTRSCARSCRKNIRWRAAGASPLVDSEHGNCCRPIVDRTPVPGDIWPR